MKKIIILFALLLNFLTLPTFAADTFVIRQIDIQGLQRISPETVTSYLPVHRGDTLRPEKTAAIIKALYKTGFFDHITLARNGDTLVIHVVERATIGQLKISGNNLIPTDKLTTVMKSLDIAEGRVYNRAILDRIKQSLLNQYYQLGRYNARITVTVTPLERDRVLVKIDISEGLAAKIKRITMIGNHAYSERKLEKQLSISSLGVFTFFTEADKYSQEKMETSLESLRNYYLDHGYLKFAVKSSQVSITPDRKSVFVTIVIEEGSPYTVKGYALSGDFVVPRSELMALIKIHPGDTFSRQAVMDAEKSISTALGNKGYIYANISLNPIIDEKNKQIFLDMTVRSGKRTYVRHITFSENTKTNDEVLRREMQQMEAAVVSTDQLEESKRRLNMLPYMKDVQMSVVPVPGRDDQVDVKYKVTENSAAEITGRIGYSQVDHVTLGAGINQKNFLGTGKTVGFNAETSRVQTNYAFNYVDPYFTPEGISRNVSLSLSRFNPKAANLSKSYSTNEYDASDLYSIPISQEKFAINRVDLGYGYQNTLIYIPQDKSYISNQVQSFVNTNGRHFQQLNLIAGLSRDSRNKAIFPTRGSRQSIYLNLFLPLDSGSLRYYTANYSGAIYHPLTAEYILTARGNLGYGHSLQGATNYPFFKNYYAGGIDSIRGFVGNTLGPKDNLLNATGGNFLIDASVGLILPQFISDTLRTTLFVDGGNVYETFNNSRYGGFGSEGPRFSTGVQAEWLSPMGPITFSLARPLNVKHHDSLKIFDFSLGANFG